MPQLFSRAANSWMRLILAAVVGSVVLGISVLMAVVRSPYLTGENVPLQQPVPFSHQHHVADAGIDCRYCHSSVETSASAGVPATQVCMNCHRYLWTEAETLEPVRASWRDETPIRWNRVHDLPGYVFFNHSIHIHKGIGCYSCHGRIDRMPLTRQAAPMTMQWCVDCHRGPEKHVRPRSLVFEPRPLEELTDTAAYHEAIRELGNAVDDSLLTASRPSPRKTPESISKGDTQANDFEPSMTIESLRHTLAIQYGLESQTDCYTCHR